MQWTGVHTVIQQREALRSDLADKEGSPAVADKEVEVVNDKE